MELSTDTDVHDTYLSHWGKSLDGLLRQLEPHDVEQIRTVTDSRQIRSLLADPVRTGVVLPSLEHFEQFVDCFISSFDPRTNSFAIWGMIHLTLKLASDATDGVTQIADMMRRLGLRLELFNACTKGPGGSSKQMKEAYLEVYIDLATFFTACIRFFRHDTAMISPGWNENHSGRWSPLLKVYNASLTSINDRFEHVSVLTRLLKENTMVNDFQGQQSLLSLSPANFTEVAKLPCVMLPAGRGSRYYNRDGITSKIDSFFYPASGERAFRSIALHGIGGVGKSHVALKYAHLKTSNQSIDVVLWFHSETDPSLAQSFTDAALALGLPGIGRDRHLENRIILHSWLQQTTCTWLLVFDNAENQDLLLEYWPKACARGSVLITTRNNTMQFHPADAGIEVPSFDPGAGSNLLFHLLRMDVIDDLSGDEERSALKLSQQLDGHALALSFIAGLIQKRSWSIQEFLSVYEKNKRGVHGPRQPNALSTIWKLSFESMNKGSAAILGILSFIHPDEVPEEIFTKASPDSLPPLLEHCTDEMDFFDLADPLLELSLAKRDKDAKAFSTHRLVQTQFRYHLATQGHRQEAFDQATKLLFDGFGLYQDQLYEKWSRCQVYIQQILSLKNNYKKETDELEPLKPTLKFCWLLRNSARYLLETADYVELEDVLSVAKSAFDKLTNAEREEGSLVLAGIQNITGLQRVHRGSFDRGLMHMRECNRIQSEQKVIDLIGLSWSEVNISNILASACEFDEALQWLLKGERTRKSARDDDDGKGVQSADFVIQQNIARVNVFLGRFDQAQVQLQAAIDGFEKLRDWGMLAYTVFIVGLLERKKNNYAAAREAFQEVESGWLAGGGQKTHHFYGACLYKLGCVANDLGETDVAIEHLENALVVTKMKENVMPGDYARVLHKLAEILKKKPGREVEAAEKSIEALRIRMGRKPSIESSASASSDGNSWSIISEREDEDEGQHDDSDEKPYDEMVYILWR
ncbi:hypothetical protein B0T17DRAFT_531004 [Bombardia bombarda]|uniref:DUF7779 domain-containing protein n=1 Tax=Bombardia bombarda TaxID=252184 RepID=A0AA40C4T8_9PEZI|nr:hypothetical protein B0T17DRAFT_531004 [Bombardia bombarda]